MSLPRPIARAAKRILYAGSALECPVCQLSFRKFLPSTPHQRPDARCPACDAVERDRLTITFLRDRTDLFDGRPKRFLHIAPEPLMAKIFRRAAGEAGYLSGDLFSPRAMEKMDITDIHHPDASFDVVYCSHVLEHVPDDRKAMREFCRVLKPDGWAILNVPITADVTDEDPSITDPQERLRRFGQTDHVRRYGPDYADRLRESGFEVNVFKVLDVVDAERAAKIGIEKDLERSVFFCRRGSSAEA
ncbi:MAG: methyltransferase domain-containing protein [Planctomycetota bacterium]